MKNAYINSRHALLLLITIAIDWWAGHEYLKHSLLPCNRFYNLEDGYVATWQDYYSWLGTAVRDAANVFLIYFFYRFPAPENTLKKILTSIILGIFIFNVCNIYKDYFCDYKPDSINDTIFLITVIISALQYIFYEKITGKDKPH